jgi:hypothetical protein
MDVTSLDLGADKRVPWDPKWGEPMKDDPKPVASAVPGTSAN